MMRQTIEQLRRGDEIAPKSSIPTRTRRLTSFQCAGAKGPLSTKFSSRVERAGGPHPSSEILRTETIRRRESRRIGTSSPSRRPLEPIIKSGERPAGFRSSRPRQPQANLRVLRAAPLAEGLPGSTKRPARRKHSWKARALREQNFVAGCTIMIRPAPRGYCSTAFPHPSRSPAREGGARTARRTLGAGPLDQLNCARGLPERVAKRRV